MQIRRKVRVLRGAWSVRSSLGVWETVGRFDAFSKRVVPGLIGLHCLFMGFKVKGGWPNASRDD